jgi:TRAP-type C4-dicarboxylate transport system substrate-binding protein
MQNKQKIKWLLFHEPIELFVRTAKDFQKHLNELTNNKFELEIMTWDDYSEKYLDGTICEPITELKKGNVQITQVFSDAAGKVNATDFYALGMPYLFESHDHATRVFEGEIGKKLFEHLYEKSGVRGLAYTYSGGYRCTASTTPIRKVEDFANKTFKRENNPIMADMIDLVKAKKVSNLPSNKEKIELSEIAQTTYPRYHVDATKSQRYVADTKHSMFLTTILCNDEFMNSLSEQDKEHFYEAALRASRIERKQSVADAEEIKTITARQKNLGIEEVVEWSDEEIAKLKQIWAPLYKKYEKFFTFDILNKIKKA